MRLPSGYSTNDYGTSAAGKGWGSGWPNCQAPSTEIIVSRSGQRLSVHPRTARLWTLLLNEMERRGYMCHVGWCWGGECRAIAGTRTPSNHSWNNAVDINAPNNPYTSSGQHDIPDWVFDLFRRFGFGVGADYSGKQDWMHFEFMGTPGDADIMTAAAEREFGGDAGGGGGNGDVGSSTGTYTVQKGDTLGRIAAKFGTTWQNLAKMNGISNPDNINVGQVLKVTGGGATRTYTVVIGDTLAKIAAKFGTTWPALAALNGINNPDDIAVGQVLKLEIVEVPPDRRDVYRSAVDHAVEASGVLYGWGSEAVTRAKRICYRTVWAETDWRNLANPSVPESLLMTPNDGNGFDMNSTGLYQQRLPWWGSVLGSMNPETATTRFLEHMVSEVADWLGRDEPDVCQRVQRSQFDGETINSKTGQPYPYAQNYKDRQAQTDALAADLAYFTNLST